MTINRHARALGMPGACFVDGRSERLKEAAERVS
jgi:hypothetical protein